MTKTDAKDLLREIQTEYNAIPYPKYLNTNLCDIKKKSELLESLKELLQDDPLYHRLLNSVQQTVNRLSRKGTWNNTSDRAINKAIPPVIKKSGKEIEFPFRWTDDETNHECMITNGYWNAKNYMVMDVVGYFFLLKVGKNRLPKTISPIFNNIESIEKREQEMKKPIMSGISEQEKCLSEGDNQFSSSAKYWVKFNDKFFRDFTGQQMSSNDILNLLLETSRVEFKLAFPVRLLDNKKMEEKTYVMNVYSRLFEISDIKEKVRNDGIVQNRSYIAIFNTILGEMFVHNLMTRNYDLVSNNLYNLPQSSQIFYRMFILHHDLPVMQYNLETIVLRMNFLDNNITNLVRNLEINTLDPLKRNGLIISYVRTKGLKGIKYLFRLPKKTIQYDTDDIDIVG